ncbi:hypothetical protein [Roseinatronobacter sp. S2]|uniref:hypothetical protein n=1 Tax=Roseinatronobacter sp. S2 TaxID=3035471 RepID=UPI00240F8587|nr:hypothetical protein [Roseinatronobacter sp. S2]WFE75909.1 hypothetical protein P8S53_05790 [Roseinatronobacter sp. S2]
MSSTDKTRVQRKHFANGRLMEEEWFKGDTPHRADGPALQEWHKNGQLKQEQWIFDGYLHRVGGPALQEWDENGRLLMERWEQRWWEPQWGTSEKPFDWLQGMHRLDGPAVKEFDLDTFELVREEWRKEGKLHREDGPAYQWWDEDGNLLKEEWVKCGHSYTPTGHEQIAWKKRCSNE